MSNGHRLNFFTILAGAAVAAMASGCDDPLPPDPPPIDPPVDPEDQQVVISDVRPPPINGGTLLITRDGQHAIAADPDRDRIVVVNLATQDVVAKVAVEAGDEPGRVVEDTEGRIHVALRRGGALVTLDAATGEALSRRDVCTAPRGLATFKPIEGGDETLVVACAGGEVVELEAAPSGAILSTTTVEPDLRDIVVAGDGTRAGRKLLVSSFRSTHVHTIGPDNTVQNQSQPRAYQNAFSQRSFSPTVAWRMVKDPEGGATMIHQRSATVPVEIEPEQPDGYGGQVFDCGSTIVHGAVSRFDEAGNVVTGSSRGGIGPSLLPVDLAVSDDVVTTWGDRLVAVVAAGSDQLMIGGATQLDQFDACDDNFFNGTVTLVGPEPIAVDFGPNDPTTGSLDVVVQIREPSLLVVFDGSSLMWKSQIALGGESRIDSGHQLFHRNPEQPTTIACASCHPGGAEDGHTWFFTQIGARRTQSLAGDITGSAPFHWDGDLEDLGELMTTVFEHRMGGFPQSEERVEALRTWLAEIPSVKNPAPTDTDAIERGKALFDSDEVGCATCHSGARLSNNTTVEIGKGVATQVPSLVGIRYRAPFMHDGCAKTLGDRFDLECGGTEHGNITHLSEAEIADLVAYMDSL